MSVAAAQAGGSNFVTTASYAADRQVLRRTLLAGAIAFAGLAGGAAAGDTSRGGWLPPTVGFAPYESSYADVAVAPSGLTVVLWLSYEAGLTAASKVPGGSWEVVPLLRDTVR